MSDVQTTLRLNDQASPILQRVASNARQVASAMQQTGRAIDQAFRSNSPNAFASTAGSAFRSVGNSAESLGNTINNIFEGADVDRFASSLDRGFRTASSGANDFISTAEGANRAMSELASSVGDLGENIDGIGSGGNGLDDVSRDASEAGEEMEQAAGKAFNLGNALKAMVAAIGVAKIAGEVKQFVSDSIQLGQGYSAMMSEVAAISGATGAEYQMLEQTARQYGATTVFSASEAAEALKYMSLAGWDANQSASALGGVLNLAASAGMGLGQASDMVTDYLSAFGMQASQSGYFADMLAYAQAHSNTSAQQLGEAYLNSAANLNAAGQDIETTTSLLEAMANQGTKGSRAGTQLAAMMRDITNKMEDGEITIGKTSVAVKDQQGNFRDLTDILFDVEKAVDGMGSAERAAALATTFTADSTKGINQILTEGMSNIARYEEELRGSTGSAEAAAGTMNDNLKGDLANMNSAFEEMQLQVFEGLEGHLRNGVQYVTTTIIPALTSWVPTAISTIGDGVARVGAAIEPFFKILLKNPKGVATALGAVGAGLLTLKAVSAGGGLLTTINGMGGLGAALTKLGTSLVAHPWALGAAAVVAGIIAIKGAVDQYNDMQVNKSLESHFGDIALSDAQISDVAGRIVGVDWLTNINLALGEFQNAEEFHQQAEEALNNNRALLWQAQVQTTLANAQQEEGTDYVQTFVSSVQTLLNNKQAESGLTYEPFVNIALKPGGGAAEEGNEGNADLLKAVRDYANAAIIGDAAQMEVYKREIAIQLNAATGNAAEGEGGNGGLTSNLFAAASAAITGADKSSLPAYAAEIAIELGAAVGEDGQVSNEELLSGIIEVVNAAVAGDHEGMVDAYNQKVVVNLLPEEGGRFLSALGTTVDLALSVAGILMPQKSYNQELSIVLTPEMQDQYKENIQTFIDGKIGELNSLTLGAKESVETVLGNKAGAALIAQIQTWTAEDTGNLENLSSSLTTLVENALKDGVLDINEQAAIEILQEKINNIVSGWQTAQANAEWKAMEFKWSGASLTSDSFSDLVEDARQQRETAFSALDQDTVSMLAMFYNWENSGKIDTAQREGLEAAWNYNYRNMKGESMIRSLGFENTSLNDAYGDTISQNMATINEDSAFAMEEMNSAWQGGNIASAQILMEDAVQNYVGSTDSADGKALHQMYETMKPDVSAMEQLIDQYAESGQAVPKAIMDSYHEAIKTGAAAGDASAAWQLYAQDFLANADMEMVDAMRNPDNPLYAGMREAMPELAQAIDRELVDTTSNVDLSNMFNALLGSAGEAELDPAALQQLLESVGIDVSEYFKEKGIDVEGGAKINLSDFDASEASRYVKQIEGMTFQRFEGENAVYAISDELGSIWEIAANILGEGASNAAIDALSDQIGKLNGIDDEMATQLADGTEIKVPWELVTDTAALQESAGKAADEVAEAAESVGESVSNETTVESEVNAAVTAGEVSGAEEAGQELANSAAEQAGNADTPEVEKTVTGNATITMTETDNVAEIYSTVGEAVTNAFANGFTASAIVDVTLTADYSLSNPTKTISFSGGATGSSTVTASLHAAGGYFDQEHLGIVAEAGPEYIIPMDGSERSREMWAEAGSILGVIDKPIETMPEGAGNGARGTTEATSSSSKDINLNINGSGSMRVASNMSKEDILDVMMANIKDVLMGIIQEEILTEGDRVYAY